MSELERILALPRRQPLDCERIPGTRLYQPKAQAVAEVETERLARKRRFPCGCLESRRICLAETDYDEVVIYGSDGRSLRARKDDFLADIAFDHALSKRVRELRPGQEVSVPAIEHPCVTTLKPVQAWTLREAPKVGGALGLIAVGGGKSILGLLMPLVFPGVRKVVLLAKSDQRHHYRLAYRRLAEHFLVPQMVWDDGAPSAIVPGMPVVYYVPYSRLSRPDATELLEQYEADLIVADEVHALSDRRSARTGRFLRYMTSRIRSGKPARFCGWSGTIVKKSVRDVAHLALHAFGTDSPMPLDPDEVEAWSCVMDPSYAPDRTSSTARALRRAFGGLGPARDIDSVLSGSESRIREGFQRRLVETPGVISTTGASVEVPIYFREWEAPPLSPEVEEALAKVRGWERPDGEEEFAEATEQARCAREVATGFYYHFAYPRGEPIPLVKDWLAKRKAWHRQLREKLLDPRPHLDSPMLCANAAERAWRDPPYEGSLPLWKAETWPAWKAVMDLVEPEQRARWIDESYAHAVAAWAKKKKAVVWCVSTAFGKKVAEFAGLPYHGGGPNAEAAILAERGDRSVIASLRAHGTGRDGLQRYFHEQLFAELIVGGDGWQQSLGRLCRPGQEADAVDTWVPLHVAENREALKKAIRGAEFIEETTGNKQFLCCSDFAFDL